MHRIVLTETQIHVNYTSASFLHMIVYYSVLGHAPTHDRVDCMYIFLHTLKPHFAHNSVLGTNSKNLSHIPTHNSIDCTRYRSLGHIPMQDSVDCARERIIGS
jgi:hypothetical protein